MSRVVHNKPEIYIQEDPNHHGLVDAIVARYGVPVWAIIDYLNVVDGSTGRVAKDYDVPEESVKAAVTYFGKHKRIIRARIRAHTIC